MNRPALPARRASTGNARDEPHGRTLYDKVAERSGFLVYRKLF